MNDTTSEPTADDIARLTQWDTPTICNALEEIVPGRRGHGFNLLGGKVGPSHAYVHVVDIGCQVTVYGLTVSTDDIVHADHHGAVMVPKSAVTAVPAVVDRIQRREAVIIEAARTPGFDAEKLKAAMGTAKDIH